MTTAAARKPRQGAEVALDARLALHRTMLLIRGVEERLAALFAEGEVPGFIHLSIGQEAIAAGVASALERKDTLASTHRGHGHALAKGMGLAPFFAEIMGRDAGACRGRGGSMHVADMSVGMLGANGIVGAGIPLAVGSALAHATRGNGAIAVAFFGDGAMAEGVLHESLNLASLWRLPVLFVCENNGWSEFSPTSRQFVADVKDIAAAFKIEAEKVDGNDVEAVGHAARRLADAVRAGGGPRLLECVTRRIRGHFEGDPQKYRDDGLAEEAADPIVRSRRGLLDAGATAEALDRLATEVASEIDEALAFARAAAPADAAAALAGVYTAREAR